MSPREYENLMAEVNKIIEDAKPKPEEGATPVLHTHAGGDSARTRLQDATGGFKVATSDPNEIKGKLIYGNTNAKFRGCDGTSWKDIAWSDDLDDYTLELAGPSDTLQLSSDAEVDIDNAAYTEAKSITITAAGKIKTKFDLKQSGGPNNTIAGKIYVNDVAVGTEHIHSLATYTTYEDTNIDVEVGDTVEVYLKSIDSNQSQVVRNFRIYYDLSTKTYIDAGDDALQTQVDAAHWDYISSATLENITGTGSISDVPATCNFIICKVRVQSYEWTEVIISRTGKTTAKIVRPGTESDYLDITFDSANNQIDYIETGTRTYDLYAFYYT